MGNPPKSGRAIRSQNFGFLDKTKMFSTAIPIAKTLQVER